MDRKFLDVPFIPDEKYLAFLAGRRDWIHSIHFSLYSEVIPDARHRYRLADPGRMAGLLAGLPGVKKYALLNSRFLYPDFYFNPGKAMDILETLDRFISASVLDGIVYTDPYLLTMLSGNSRRTASRLEAVPSVNCMVDTFDKLHAVLSMTAQTHFKLPEKLCLDRSLNRRPDDLAAFAGLARTHYPGLKLSLMANEGCLYQCPFKLTHDSHIALVNMNVGFDTRHLNMIAGCIRYLEKKPDQVFKSPFIRPEDVDFYSESADLIKICGRTLGPEFLIRAVSAYISGAYDGNLLLLMDSVDWMSERYYVSNACLSEDFVNTMCSCSKICDSCNFCKSLWDRCATRTPLEFKNFRNKTE